MLISLLLSTHGFSQQLACNDLIQVSLDENCHFKLNLDMLLEAPPSDTTCLIIRVTDSKGNVVPNGEFGAMHRDKTYDYAVMDTCNDNSCWGQVLVEDKLPPQFDCQPFDTVWCNDFSYVLPNDQVFEACGSYQRVIESDVMINYPCDSSCAGKQFITYYYVDESGNRSEVCIKEICYRRATLADIDYPDDKIYDCAKNQNTNPLSTGRPQVDGKPIYPDAGYCEVECDYKDQVLEICPGSYKILRKWTCYDWCQPTGPDNPHIDWQAIKIVDEDGPIVYCPTTDSQRDTIGTDPWTCTGSTQLPVPHILNPGQSITDSSAVYIIAECSDVTYSVKHLPATSPEDCTPDKTLVPSTAHVRYNSSAKRWEAFDLPQGCNWFYYTFVDECGNKSECTFDIYVVDDVPPIAVCDHHTTVTLNEQGDARVRAITFDDNSIDNCMIDSMDVRRMTSTCAQPTTLYGSYVDFCCDDIGHPVSVEFRVFDKNGNVNTCMVEVEVQDKVAPHMIPPPDITVDCRFDFDENDLSVFGNVVIDESWRKPIIIKDVHYSPDYYVGLDGWAWDNCPDLNISESASVSLNCGGGTIRRTFTATDPQGLKVSRTQTITIVDRTPFGFSNIKFPRTLVEIKGCVGVDTDPSKTGEPSYLNVGCAEPLATYKDKLFTQVPDACYKIERTWTVIDWCAFNLGRTPWQWDMVQIIKVYDDDPPVFAQCARLEFCDVGASLQNGVCMGAVDMEPDVSDKCTPKELLTIRYRIDQYNTGTYGAWVAGDRIQGNFPVGEHRVQWEVSDGCGNTAKCDHLFEVKDCKAPTPYCRDGIVTVLMEGVGEVAVWAKDLNIGSFDNCTDTSQLIFSFDEKGRQASKTYRCQDLNGQRSLLDTVRMYVTDECGNNEYCEVVIEIQDNKNCAGTLVLLRGNVHNEVGSGLRDANIEVLDPSSRTILYRTVTDGNGDYEVAVPSGAGYIVRPELDINHINGISTRDLALIQKDLLGLQNLPSAYTMFSADANNTQSVSAGDISEIRKLILGRTARYNNNTSWRFVPSDFVMTDARYPWGGPEEIDLSLVSNDESGLDFIAMKTGDVDVSATTNLEKSGTRTSVSVEMTYEVNILQEGLYEVVFYEVDRPLVGWQGTLDFGARSQVVEVIDGIIALKESNMNIEKIDEGKIGFSWTEYDGRGAEGEVLLKVRVESQGAVVLRYTSEIVSMEAFDAQMQEVNVVLRNRENEADFALLQNVPNPFSGSTVIGFELPRNQEFVLSFYDMNGKVLKVINGFGSKGRNEMEVGKHDFHSASGTVIFYQLDTETQTATRKLVMLE